VENAATLYAGRLARGDTPGLLPQLLRGFGLPAAFTFQPVDLPLDGTTASALAMMKSLMSLQMLVLASGAVAMCIGALTAASAQDRCVVADPSGTPLNVRTAPNRIQVTIFDRASDEGSTWVYVGQYEDRVPIGWVYRNEAEIIGVRIQEPETHWRTRQAEGAAS
jgi:hypothetical protein